MNSIEIKNLSKEYATFKLNNINMDIKKGYITGFIGENGAGKTTTFKCIINSVVNYSGDIKVLGKCFDEVKDDVGIVMDTVFFPDNWKIVDIDMTLSKIYHRWDSKLYFEYINKFNIDTGKQIKELSRGMKVKVMLASALAHKAKLLLLDEPTSGLDPVARDELMDYLLDYLKDENNSILFSTHITNDLEKVADYIVYIKNGEIKYSGQKDEVLENYRLIKGDSSSLKNRDKIIGLTINNYGFNGMIKIEDMDLFKDCSFEKITLDDFTIYMSKDGKNDEQH